jgi:hypothetical protein
MRGVCADPAAVCDDGLACIKDPSLGPICQAQVSAGQPCSGSAECQAGSLCLVDPTTGAGTCGQLPVHDKTCDPTSSPARDLFTDYRDPDTKVCTSRVAPGGDCPKRVECAWYERCDLTQATPKCIARGMVGASCAADDECLDSLSCASGKCAIPVSRACATP